METVEKPLTKANVQAAIERLEIWGPLSINRTLRFHNALEAFSRDVEHEQGARSLHRVFCVDPSEIVAFARYDRPAWNAFTFGGILDWNLAESAETKERVREQIFNIDRLILRHLLFDRRGGCVLLDPHADELVGVTGAYSDALTKEHIVLDQQIFQGDLSSLTHSQFERILSWLQNPETDQQDEFDTFRNTFLPGLRTTFVERLYELQDAVNWFQKFSRDGNYHFVASLSAGARSFIHPLRESGINVDWHDLDNFTKRSDIQDQFENVTGATIKLINAIDRSRRSPRAKERATERDARAFATIHVLNLFFRMQQLPARVELVTRTPVLHSVIGALPPGQIHVTVRHPLLVPEVYDFDPPSLMTIGHIYKWVASALRPVLDAYWNPRLTKTSSAQADFFPEETNKLIRSAAQELLRALSDVISVQQTLEQKDAQRTIEEIIEGSRETSHSSRQQATKRSPQTTPGVLSKQVINLFDVLRDRLRNQSDPFSVEAITKIAGNNLHLIDFERSRLGENARQGVQFRFLRIAAVANAFPLPFIAFRPVTGRLRRLFHLYSQRAPRIFDDQRSVRPSAGEPMISQGVSVGELLDDARKALVDLDTGAAATPDVRIEKIEETMLVCVAFASLGHYSTSATLASTVLNQVMRQFRVVEVGSEKFTRSRIFPEGTDPRVPLALKELFLVRHYCERALARQQLDSRLRLLSAGKSQGVRNIGRAQRDLDLAVEMNEHAERLAGGLQHDPSPAGVNWLDDFRFPLISFFGWIDQYIASLARDEVQPHDIFERQEAAERRELWRRHDIWTAVASSKEMEILAWRARLKSSHLTDDELIRYFSHMEARALHGLLVLFIVHLAFDISPEMQTFWNPNARPTSDRILVFRNWNAWRKRHQFLLEEFHFDMRLAEMFELVFGTMDEIDVIARQRIIFEGEGRKSSGDHGTYQNTLERFVERMKRERSKFVHGDGDVTFASELIDQLVKRAQLLARR